MELLRSLALESNRIRLWIALIERIHLNRLKSRGSSFPTNLSSSCSKQFVARGSATRKSLSIRWVCSWLPSTTMRDFIHYRSKTWGSCINRFWIKLQGLNGILITSISISRRFKAPQRHTWYDFVIWWYVILNNDFVRFPLYFLVLATCVWHFFCNHTAYQWLHGIVIEILQSMVKTWCFMAGKYQHTYACINSQLP